MPIQDTALFDDMVRLIGSRENSNDTRFRYSLELLMKDTSVVVSKLWTLNVVRDFVTRYSDYLTVTVSVTRYEYEEMIFPNREDIIGELIIEAMDEKTNKPSGSRSSQQFRAKLTVIEDEGLKYGDVLAKNTTDKQSDLKEISIQLINLDLERMRLRDISAVARGNNIEDLLMVSMAMGADKSTYTESSDIYEPVEEEPYDGRPIDMHPPDRTEVIEQLLIPDGLTLAELPAWTQKYGGGVYENNLGFYVYRDFTYIYPIYDTRSYVDRRKMVIYSAGPGEFLGMDKTYKVETGLVSILSTGEVRAIDNTEAIAYNEGNGVRFSLPSFNNKDTLTHDNGESKFNEIYYTHVEGDDILTNTVVHKRVTANAFYEVSRVSANKGILASFQWQNANHGLILPNTEVTILYKNGDKVHERVGVVIGFEYESQMLENDAHGSHQGNGVIHCFINK